MAELPADEPDPEPEPAFRSAPAGGRPSYLEQLLTEGDARPLTRAEFERLIGPFLGAGDGEG